MGHSIFSPWYWFLKFAATLLRSSVYLKRGTQRYLRNLPLPDGIARERLQVPSRDKGRYIGVDLYRPANVSTSTKLPVLVNWHGSGYVIPSWGEDYEFIHQAVKALGCIVLDSDYRKGPENTYPAAHDDAEDVVGWVLSQSQRFNLHHVALSGFSAGAGLALYVGNFYGPSKIQAISCLYPPADLSPEPAKQPVPYEARSGLFLSPAVIGLFNNSYIPILSTRAEPRVRIRGLENPRFPNHIFVATGEIDVLHANAKKFFGELALAEKDKKVTFVSVPKEDHAWDKKPLVPESVEARDNAYRQMFDNIKAAWSS